MRRQSDGLFRTLTAAVFVWTAFILAGMAYLALYNPVTDLDRKCLKSSLAEMQACIDDYNQLRRTP